jgi:SAM-dependent methyltransferase
MRASALRLPLSSASVDLVITLDVLQHLPLDGGDRQALNEAARVLKPGGYVFARTNAQSFPHTADDPQFEFRKYDRPQLRQRLEDAGFEVLRLSRINALLGLAEIPRELRARHHPNSYHGILSQTRFEPAWRSTLKRRWLAFEGRALRMGVRWPLGRSFVALGRRRVQ